MHLSLLNSSGQLSNRWFIRPRQFWFRFFFRPVLIRTSTWSNEHTHPRRLISRWPVCGLLLAVCWLALSGPTHAQTISTVAGNSTGRFSGDGGPATQAGLFTPTGVVADAAGNFFIVGEDRVRKVNPAGIINTVAGTGTREFSGDGGPATQASLNIPIGATVDAAGNLFIADFYNNRIRKVSPAGIITTVAGNGQFSFSGDGGPATEASLYFPYGVAVDKAGNLFIADGGNSRIRKVSPSGIISTVAGNGTQGFSGDGGPATEASLYFLGSITVDGTGNIYLADSYNNRIRKINPAGIISTVVGNGNKGFSGDGGTATEASLHYPSGMALDAVGNLFIADQFNNRIRKVSPSGIISTVAGNGTQGFSGDGGTAIQASLSRPGALSIDRAGNLLIADTYNDRVRKVDLNTLPTVSSIIPGQVATVGQPFSYVLPANAFTDAETPNALTYTVRISPANGLSYDATSRTISGTPTTSGISSVTVVAADPGTMSATQSLVITVNCPVLTANIAGNRAVCSGQSTVLTASQGTAYQWSTGVVTASITVTAGTYSVTVTTPSGCQATATATVATTPTSPDYQPLVDLYNSTDGPNWNTKTNWLTGCTPCGWYGVTCDGNGRVTGLNLILNGLIGTIPASLGNLSNLQSLRLPLNYLYGTIPESLGNLTNLRTFDLSTGIYLSGSIPASLVNLTKLETLNLQGNSLSGSIPASLSALTNLRNLYLSYNELTGAIPASLSALTNLQILELQYNKLSGCFPASLSFLCGKEVNVSNNPSLPGGGNFAAFCNSGAGSDAFRPIATARPNSVCAGNPVSLSVTAGSSYQWSGPAGFTASVQTPGFTPATSTSSGLYLATVGNGSPTCTATASVSLTVNPPPVVSITGLATAYCKDAPTVTLTGTPAGGRFTIDGLPATQFAPTSLSPGSYAIVYSYTNINGCSGTASQTVTINTLPAVSITGLASAYCQDAPALLLTGTPMGGSFTIDGTPATQLNPTTLMVGNRTVNYRYTDSNRCSNTATQSVTIKATPPAPTLLTQSGGTYPASQSVVTVDINSGNVNLAVGGCSGDLVWNGPNNSSGTSATIVVPTTQPGVFIYRATCTLDGCTSPLATATVTVAGRLTVLHRDVDNYVDNNAIQPVIVLQNQGTGSLPLSNLTLRYYLTVEGAAALSNLSINYAQVSNQNVRLRYVPLQPVQQGAAGYVEYSFTGAAGDVAAGGNSGPIQAYFAKNDYSALNERDDYSYAAVRDQLVATLRITAYYNGVLIAGVEPGSAIQVRALRALTESKNGPSATQISTFLEVRNEGNVPVNYSDLKARYYFTADGNERLQVDIDEGNVRAQLVKLPQAIAGADYYLEISYLQGGQLAPGASAGLVRYRISKPDGGRFNQVNDYSYQEQPAERSSNSRVVVYAGVDRIWGTEPSGSARLAASEPRAELTVRVLGNPMIGQEVTVEISGAEGQPLLLQLNDSNGRLVAEQRLERAEATERQTLSAGTQPAGLLLLRVSTPMQHQTVKVLKAD